MISRRHFLQCTGSGFGWLALRALANAEAGGALSAKQPHFPAKAKRVIFLCMRGGLSYGETDEHGYEAVANRVHIHDWHATILHLIGLNHERLTFRHAGREMRLTDVKGNVAKEIVA